MPKVSKASASHVEVIEGILEDRSENLDGYTTGFTSFLADMDPTPMFQGLPDDRCQCPHWGYVIKGKYPSGLPIGRKRTRRAMRSTCRRDTRR